MRLALAAPVTLAEPQFKHLVPAETLGPAITRSYDSVIPMELAE